MASDPEAARAPDRLCQVPRAPASRLGLAVALGSYFVLLASVIGLLLGQVASMHTVLYFDVALLAVGLALFIGFWNELGALLGPPGHLDLRTGLMGVGGLGLVFLVVQVLAVLFPGLFSDVMQRYRAEGAGLAVAIFQMGPLTALGEELLFRGVILGGLRRALPERAAIAVSAAMFATIHLSPSAFVHTGLLGLLLAWLVVRTGSLWPSILLHAAWNTTIVLIAA